jgi:polyribonucleotide nucleotidyltransferase
VLKVGQVVRIKVIEADDKGRLRLSMKAIGGIEAQGGPQGPVVASES